MKEKKKNFKSFLTIFSIGLIGVLFFSLGFALLNKPTSKKQNLVVEDSQVVVLRGQISDLEDEQVLGYILYNNQNKEIAKLKAEKTRAVNSALPNENVNLIPYASITTSSSGTLGTYNGNSQDVNVLSSYSTDNVVTYSTLGASCSGISSFADMDTISCVDTNGENEYTWSNASGLSYSTITSRFPNGFLIKHIKMTGSKQLTSSQINFNYPIKINNKKVTSSFWFGITGLTNISFSGDVTSVEYIYGNSVNVTTLSNSFNSNTGVVTVNIPDGVNFVGNGGFTNCSNLKSVCLPTDLTSLLQNAFKGCSSLESVFIPDTVTITNTSLFENCSNLKYVKLSSGMTELYASTFSGCSSLETIDIPNAVTSVGENCFKNCEDLECVIVGNGLQTIGANAFDGCTNLKYLIINSLLLTTIEDGAIPQDTVIYAPASVVSAYQELLPNNEIRVMPA